MADSSNYVHRVCSEHFTRNSFIILLEILPLIIPFISLDYKYRGFSQESLGNAFNKENFCNVLSNSSNLRLNSGVPT